MTIAAASGKTSDVVRSIDLGAEVNTTLNSYTPLMRAANWGHVGTLAALIEEGADLFAMDRQNRTALDWSRIARHDKAARMLERAMENEILHRRYHTTNDELLCDPQKCTNYHIWVSISFRFLIGLPRSVAPTTLAVILFIARTAQNKKRLNRCSSRHGKLFGFSKHGYRSTLKCHVFFTMAS